MQESASNPLTLSGVKNSHISLDASESTSSFDSACRLEEEEVSEFSSFSAQIMEEYVDDVISLKLDSRKKSKLTNNSELLTNWLNMFKV